MERFIKSGDTYVIEKSLSHPENYGYYAPLANGEDLSIDVSVLNKSNYNDHYNWIMNVFKDGIESELVRNNFIRVIFTDGVAIDLSLADYLLNIIMWNMFISTDIPIESKHIFFNDEINQDSIKDYIDELFIEVNRKRFSNKDLNNIIDDTLYRIHDIDQFAMFLANTVNLEDNVYLMELSPEFNECIHADLSKVPIEDVKSVGMQYTDRILDVIKNSKHYLGYDHCLADAARAGQGINPKQFKEVTINIGTKPDGRGGIFPVAINKSFMNGGVVSPTDYFIESSTGRTAQIIKFKNVGYSGSFARLLGLNNMDSYLNPDPHYDCHSQNFVQITIKNKKTLKVLRNKYYRLHPNGMEMLIDVNDESLIGKTIYMRSPMTCASAARGQGICYKCYGDLAYAVYDANINFGVNIGRIASEILSSALTQKLLSAKHLLETFIEKIVWVKKFNELFEIEANIISLSQNVNLKDYKLIINPDTIELENEEDDDLSDIDDEGSSMPIYNEYITDFEVAQISTGEIHCISNDKQSKLYISNELNNIIRRKAKPIDGKIYIDFADLKDITLFIIHIDNNELSKTLEHLKNILDKNETSRGMNIHQFIQALIDTVIEGGLKITSTHLEVIASNQIRDAHDILKKPKWFIYDPDYQILSLNRALTCNPSVTISLSYQKVSQLLYNPLTYKKKGSSFMDLFFMEQPQYIINGVNPPSDNEFKPKPNEFYEPMVFFEDPDKITGVDGGK